MKQQPRDEEQQDQEQQQGLAQRRHKEEEQHRDLRQQAAPGLSVPALPTTVAGLRALIGAGVHRGINLAHELEPSITDVMIRSDFRRPEPEAWAECDARIYEVRDDLLRGGAARLPAYCASGAPARRAMSMALHEALLAGMEAYRDALLEGGRQVPVDQRTVAVMPADPALVLRVSEGIVERLLALLAAMGIVAPGAAASTSVPRHNAVK